MWQQPNQYSWYIGGTSYRQICWTQLKELSFARSLSMSRWPDGYGLEKQKWQIWLSAFDLVDSTSKWTNCDKLQSIRTDLWRKRTNLWKKRTNLWRKKTNLWKKGHHCTEKTFFWGKRTNLWRRGHHRTEKDRPVKKRTNLRRNRTNLWRKGHPCIEKGKLVKKRTNSWRRRTNLWRRRIHFWRKRTNYKGKGQTCSEKGQTCKDLFLVMCSRQLIGSHSALRLAELEQTTVGLHQVRIIS